MVHHANCHSLESSPVSFVPIEQGIPLFGALLCKLVCCAALLAAFMVEQECDLHIWA